MAGKQFELLFQLTATLGPNFSQSFKNASKTMAALQSDLRNADSKLKDVSAYQKQQQAVAKSKEKVSELQAEHERLTKEIEESGQATPKLTRQLEANEKAMQKAKDATQREEERLNQLGNTLREAGVNTNNLGQNTEELRKKYERLEQTQKKVQEITEKQAANKQAIQQTKSQLTGLVGTVAALGTAIYAGPVKKAAEFEEQMSTVKSITGSVSDEDIPGLIEKANEMGLSFKEGTNSTETAMNILAAKAKQMGATTAFTAAEAGEAMEYMAMAGWKSENMLEGIEGIMNLASASGEELGSVSDIVTDALTAFGLKAGNAGHFSDVLAQASSNANTNVSMMGSTFQKVAPVAGALGYSVEDMSLGIGLMANASIKAEVAGTSLKTALANMAKPTKQQATYMNKYGISLTQADGTMKSFGEVVENLRSSLGGLGEQEQIAAATAIFGKESFAGMLAIVNASEQDFNKLTDAVYNCDGAAKRMADIKLDNLNGSITLAKSAFDALQVELGEMLLPMLTEGIKRFTKITEVVTTFVRENPEAVKTIAKVAASLIGLKAGSLVAKMGFLQVKGGLLSIQKAFTTIKGLGFTKYLSSMGGGFGGIVAKISPLIGIVTAVGGAIYYVSNHLEQVRGFIQKTFGDEGLAVFDKLWGIISQVGATIKSVFFTNGTGGILDTLKSVLPTILSMLQTTLLPILPVIGNLIMQIVSVIGQLISAVLPVLGQLISAILPVLGQLISAILPVIINLVRTLLPVIMQIVQSVLPVFIQLFNVIVPVLSQIIQAILPVIINLVRTLLPIIMQIVQSVLPVFVELFNAIVPVLSQIIQTILPVIINLVQTILPIIMQIIDTVLPVFISLLDIIVPIFQNIVQAILPVFQEIIQALIPVIQTLAEIFANVLGAALNTISNIIGSVMQVFQGLIDFIKNVFTGNWSQAWEAVKNIFSNVFKGLGEIFKAPFRAIVSVINGVIRGLNKLKIPDWVPIVGGAQLNIPEIPEFAKGTNKTPSTFIAGEQGPELITNAANRKVFTAAQTGQIFSNMAKAKNIVENVGSAGSANNVNMVTNGAGTIVIQVTNSPSVTVTGSSSGNISEIKGQLQQYDEEFLEKLREMIHMVLREQQERESRVAYV